MSNIPEKLGIKAAEEKIEAAEADVCCANCGAAGVDDIKLEECDGCDLVKYCRDKCQEDHREKHEEECNKRAKELHDKELFTQPDGTNLGECPLCFLPMPIDPEKYSLMSCCSSYICNGCLFANIQSNLHDEAKALRCPFCREPAADEEESNKRNMKRIQANDPAALRLLGEKCYKEGDYDSVFEYCKKATDAGDTDSHYSLGNMYGEGLGVEKDEEKAVYHFEKAAIGGDPYSRHILAFIEGRNGNIERAVQHHIIAANLGYELSMKELWVEFKDGNITKENLDATLRTHQAALDATKSEQREAAEEICQTLF